MYQGKNQYAPMAGVPSLREAIAKKIAGQHGVVIDSETEVTITAGATQAIYTAISALVHEGDEVVVFTPAYDCYIPAIELAGGIPKVIPLEYPEFKVDWEQVRRSCSVRTKAILINTPHNPSATLWTDEDMLQLERCVAGTDIVILSDEVYEAIVFDGAEHQSVLKYPGLVEKSMAIFSFGKAYHITGWKTGYVVAPKELMAEFRKVHQYLVFSVNTPVQYALADYMEQGPSFNELAQLFQAKRNLFLAHLEGSRFTWEKAGGSYFQLLNYEKITDEPDTLVAENWTKEHGVAAIPISVFYQHDTDPKALRFCFAKEDDDLKRAAERLCKI